MSGILTLLMSLVFCSLPAFGVAQEKFIASYAGFAGFQAPLWAAKDFGFLANMALTPILS